MRYTVRVEMAVAIDLDLEVEAEDVYRAAEIASEAADDAEALRTLTERFGAFNARCAGGDVVVSDVHVTAPVASG